MDLYVWGDININSNTTSNLNNYLLLNMNASCSIGPSIPHIILLSCDFMYEIKILYIYIIWQAESWVVSWVVEGEWHRIAGCIFCKR